MLTVVSGPPCSGKSTYIEAHAKSGDVIVDLDRLALALSPDGTTHHHYPGYVRLVAMRARATAVDALLELHRGGGGAVFNVWIIDSEPSMITARKYAHAGAVRVTLNPGLEVCLTRAQGTRPDHVITYIHKWFAQNRAPVSTNLEYAEPQP